jgi:hypothetical protein
MERRPQPRWYWVLLATAVPGILLALWLLSLYGGIGATLQRLGF